MSATPRFELENMLSHLLRRAHFHAEARFAEKMGELGVTSRQLALLVTIAQNPDASQNRLGELIALDKNTISEMIVRMVKKRLIERETSGRDKRSYRLSLTDSGRRIVERSADLNPAYQVSLAENLSEAENRKLIELLRRMVGL